MLMFGPCILTDPMKVCTGTTRREGASFGCNVRIFRKKSKIPKHKILQRALLLNYTSYNAEPTLRLFGIVAFTKYVNFNLING